MSRRSVRTVTCIYMQYKKICLKCCGVSFIRDRTSWWHAARWPISKQCLNATFAWNPIYGMRIFTVVARTRSRSKCFGSFHKKQTCSRARHVPGLLAGPRIHALRVRHLTRKCIPKAWSSSAHSSVATQKMHLSSANTAAAKKPAFAWFNS